MTKKIFSRMDDKAYGRLAKIRKEYGFKSEYEILQYVVACFLRVADPENDTNPEPVPDEIESMFYDLSEADKQFDFVKPKRSRKDTKQMAALNG